VIWVNVHSLIHAEIPWNVSITGMVVFSWQDGWKRGESDSHAIYQDNFSAGLLMI